MIALRCHPSPSIQSRSAIWTDQGRDSPRHRSGAREPRNQPHHPRRAQAEGVGEAVEHVPRRPGDASRGEGQGGGAADACPPGAELEDPDDVGLWLDTVASELGDLSSSGFGTCSASIRQRRSARGKSTGSSRSASRRRACAGAIAKDGISTGWDCPRAEVLFSSVRAETTRTLPSCWDVWCARRSPAEYQVTTCSIRLTAFCRTSTEPLLSTSLNSSQGSSSRCPASGRRCC